MSGRISITQPSRLDVRRGTQRRARGHLTVCSELDGAQWGSGLTGGAAALHGGLGQAANTTRRRTVR